MKLKENIHVAFESLLENKFRTLLTMLGMIIGVFAVVTLVSLGNGAKLFVLNEFQGLGTNLIMIQPGKSEKKGMFGPPVGSAARKMTLADVEALQRKTTTLEAVSGIVLAAGNLEYQSNLVTATIFAVNDQFDKILSFTLAQGNFFSKEEDAYARRVIVLGSDLSKSLFGLEYPIGRTIRINESNFKVGGVLSKMGNKLGIDLDQIAMIPTHTGLKLFNEDSLFGIRARARASVSVDIAVEEIQTIFRERRNGKDDVTVLTQKAMMDSLDSILGVLSYALAGIAAISMLVGGIGIMNMMLVSVTERIEEIGIRRAVGATQREISAQFLTEALILSIMSAFFGVVIAFVVGALATSLYPKLVMEPPLWIVLSSIGLSLFVGLIFGVLPARKASKVDTLEALRHE
jgi:putative ABC transport system permease protein